MLEYQRLRLIPAVFAPPSLRSKGAEPSEVQSPIQSVPYKFCTKFKKSGGLEKNGRKERVLGHFQRDSVRRFIGEARVYWGFCALV